MGKELNFKNIEALDNVKKVVTEAGEALKDPMRTIEDSAIPEVLGGVVGAGAGAAIGFGALYTLGVSGLSAAGITSGLAAAGSVIGGGMVAGIGGLAAPVAVAGVAGYAFMANKKKKRLIQAKQELLKQAVQQRDAILQKQKADNSSNKERVDYLNSLNVMLQAAVRDLRQDLGVA